MPDAVTTNDPIHDPAEPRKPRSRWALYAPFVLLAIAAVATCAYWFVISGQVKAGIEKQAGALREAGYIVDLSGGKVGGFPYRLKVSYDEARIVAPSGWAVAAPGFEAEAVLYKLGHWVVAAPQGLTVTRPEGGPIVVKGELRGSVNGLKEAPWRVVLQARKASFTPGAGARGFSLASADLVEFYLKPSGKADEGAALLRIEGGKGALGTLGGHIAEAGQIKADINARITHPRAFNGAGWSDAVRAWTQAGGVVDQIQGEVVLGAVTAKANAGTLGAGADGRLVGAAPLQITQAGKALSVLSDTNTVAPEAAGAAAAVAAARAQGGAATVNLVFQAGVATFGPVKIGPAPKVG